MRLVQEVTGTTTTYCGEITSFPGNADVAVSTSVYRMSGPEGYGRWALVKRERQVKELGYNVLMATVDANNARQIHIMEAEGYTAAFKFKSKRTGNTIIMFAKELSK